MSNPSIIPSAQRLAEANNVNWRALQGSGDGGSVVERDVLAHLARVMLGEEETNPTPEPLPEGMRAWPEELESHQRIAQESFAVTETAPEMSDLAAPSEDDSPWSLEPSAPEPTPAPVAAGWDDAPSPEVEAEPEAEYTFSAPDVQAEPEADDSVLFEAPGFGTDNEAEPAAETYTGSGDDRADAPVSVPVAGVSEEVHRAALDELETLKARVETLLEERSRHLGELEQLPRLQETIESQNAEVAKLGTLQGEVGQLRDQLASARAEAQRAQELAALNQDLEARLERAREFKEGAKVELERIMATKEALEAQLAAATKPKRPWWRFGG